MHLIMQWKVLPLGDVFVLFISFFTFLQVQIWSLEELWIVISLTGISELCGKPQRSFEDLDVFWRTLWERKCALVSECHPIKLDCKPHHHFCLHGIITTASLDHEESFQWFKSDLNFWWKSSSGVRVRRVTRSQELTVSCAACWKIRVSACYERLPSNSLRSVFECVWQWRPLLTTSDYYCLSLSLLLLLLFFRIVHRGWSLRFSVSLFYTLPSSSSKLIIIVDIFNIRHRERSDVRVMRPSSVF